MPYLCESCRNAQMFERIAAIPVRYPFRFTVLGDTAPSADAAFDAAFTGLLAQMSTLTPAPLFMVNLGDFSGPGTRAGHRHYAELTASFPLPHLCVRGNHECDDPVGHRSFAEFVGAGNAHFAYGNTLFVLLKCHSRRLPDDAGAAAAGTVIDGPTDAELAYLDSCLRQDTHAARIVLMHQPPAFSGRFRGLNGDGFTHLEREFLHLLQRHEVALVCCAHVIAYDFHTRGGTAFLTSGGGGYALESQLQTPPQRGRFHHFVEIAVAADGAVSTRVFKAGDGSRPLPGYDMRIPARGRSGSCCRVPTPDSGL